MPVIVSSPLLLSASCLPTTTGDVMSCHMPRELFSFTLVWIKRFLEVSPPSPTEITLFGYITSRLAVIKHMHATTVYSKSMFYDVQVVCSLLQQCNRMTIDICISKAILGPVLSNYHNLHGKM